MRFVIASILSVEFVAAMFITLRLTPVYCRMAAAPQIDAQNQTTVFLQETL